ncbi:MAG: hypothetical protein J6V04_05400, partial [Bacteroidales bacterium]|nr:hypothetical protein [Bacteroidales bacterium]
MKNNQMGNNPNQFNPPKGPNEPQQGPRKPQMRRRGSYIWIIYLIFTGALFYLISANTGSNPKNTQWFEVKEKMIPQGDVEKITFVSNLHKAEVFIKKDSLSK